MSDVVNTDTVEFYRGRQNHVGGVAVTVSGISACRAPERSFTQREPLLGSRTTTRASHRRIGGRHQHHLPARPRRPFDQFTFRRTDSRISGFTCHRRAGQKPRFEVLDRDRVMVGNDTSRPYSGGVSVLPGSFLMQAGGSTASPLVSLTRGVPTWASPARHLPLRTSEFGDAPFPIPTVEQVMIGAGGRRGRCHTPVDPDATRHGGRGIEFAADNERRVPVAEAVAVHAYRRRHARQFTRPHHRHGNPLREPQATVSDREPALGVFQRRQCPALAFNARPTTALQCERLVERLRVSPQSLLLGDLRAFPQPRSARPGFGQQLRQPRESRFTAGFLLMDGFIPYVSAAVPFGFERTRSHCARTQPVGVTHDLLHTEQHPPAWQPNQGLLVGPTAARVPEPRVPATQAVDQLILRRHSRRRDLGGYQNAMPRTRRTLERHTDSSPHLKAGVSSELLR